MVNKLKEKWGISSNVQLILILIVFSLAGSTVTFIRKYIFFLIGIKESTPFWIKALVYIPLIVPIYYISLLSFAYVFGQWDFFYTKVINTFKRVFKAKNK